MVTWARVSRGRSCSRTGRDEGESVGGPRVTRIAPSLKLQPWHPSKTKLYVSHVGEDWSLRGEPLPPDTPALDQAGARADRDRGSVPGPAARMPLKVCMPGRLAPAQDDLPVLPLTMFSMK